MTRRDYVRLARVIGDRLASPDTSPEQAEALLALTADILPVLTAENGRFNPALFLRAIDARVREHAEAGAR